MKRWLVMLLVACTALAGLGAARRQLAEPEVLSSLEMPPAADAALLPVHLSVRPDGAAFAVWHLSAGQGLAVWQEGSSQSVPLSNSALGELAWAPDGLYFAEWDAPVGGRARILHYRWGDSSPQVVVEGKHLKGKPRALAWRTPGWLYFADDEGLKAAQPGASWRVERIPGSAVPDTLQYGAFAPDSLRYIGIKGGSLALAEAGREAIQPLIAVKGENLTRTAWSQDGSRLALGLGHAETGGRVLLLEVTSGGTARSLAEVKGGSPVFLGDRLLFVDPTGRVMQWQEGEVAAVGEHTAASLATGPAQGPLYIVRRTPDPEVLRVPLR